MKMFFFARVENGEIEWPEHAREYISSLSGKSVEVTITEYRNTRTDRQNRYWHGVVVEMFREAMGYEKTAANHMRVHEYLKIELNSEALEIVDQKTGEIRTVIIAKPTAILSTVEFNELKERAQKLGTE